MGERRTTGDLIVIFSVKFALDDSRASRTTLSFARPRLPSLKRNSLGVSIRKDKLELIYFSRFRFVRESFVEIPTLFVCGKVNALRNSKGVCVRNVGKCDYIKYWDFRFILVQFEGTFDCG